MPSDRIREILDKFSEELEGAICAEIQVRLRNVADGIGGKGKGKVDAPVYLKGRKNIPPHCKYPDCKAPHLGPRYGYFCKDHRPEQYLRPGPRSKTVLASAQPILTAVPDGASSETQVSTESDKT
jgi:hypothetical protein